MPRRIVLALSVLAAIGLTVAAMPQPPAAPPADPAPPRPLPGMATTPVPQPQPQPARVVAEAPINLFEPLSAYPHQTQAVVRSVLLAGNWMTRMNQSQGRFMYGYDPALRQALPGDHDLRQARGALGLAQAAKFTGDEKQAAIASQAVLTLLAATRPDPADANCRVPVHASVLCNRVGFAATVALAIYELPAADPKLLAEAEKLCEFLRRQCRPDGSVHYTDNPTDDPAKVDPDAMNEYPGLALQAVAASSRVKPAAWKTEAVKKGGEHYRAAFRARPHPLLAATVAPALAELYVQTKLPDAAAGVYELNDWLCGMQIPGNDSRVPQWAGAFRGVAAGRVTEVAPGPETGVYVQSLASACVVTRLTPDLDRHAKYKAAVSDAVQFLTGLQYGEANTRHFETTFRANMLIGGFHVSPLDGDLRIDATGTAVSGLVRYLGSGAEK
jgi:hypothetical protein